mmetsp:Transcript_30303/g.55536  ORF Transcript_30303/g.55536 Transcript_30303/m.55536 type:complete len:92 (-) Transcript_30303:97-372(-)
MPFKCCACNWSTRGGVSDLLGHARGKHGVDAVLQTEQKFIPPRDGQRKFAQCLTCKNSGCCDRYFDGHGALINHFVDVHDLRIEEIKAKKK